MIEKLRCEVPDNLNPAALLEFLGKAEADFKEAHCELTRLTNERPRGKERAAHRQRVCKAAYSRAAAAFASALLMKALNAHATLTEEAFADA